MIGQCQGHRRGCGRFYCAEHSADRLCIDCQSDVSVDYEAQVRYVDYSSASLGLVSTGQSKHTWSTAAVLTGLVFLVALGLVLAGVRPPRVPDNTLNLVAWASAGALALEALLWRRADLQERFVRQRYVNEPGFQQFAMTWERQWRERTSDEQDARNRERLVNLIASALITAAPTDGARAIDAELT